MPKGTLTVEALTSAIEFLDEPAGFDPDYDDSDLEDFEPFDREMSDLGFDHGEGGYAPAYPDDPDYMMGYRAGQNVPW